MAGIPRNRAVRAPAAVRVQKPTPTQQEALRAAQSEKSFQAQVIALAKLRGWLTHHVHDSRRSPAGLPDLLLVRVARWDAVDGPLGRIIFAELKTERGRVTLEQRQWLEALAQCRVEAYLWRPSDWPILEKILE